MPRGLIAFLDRPWGVALALLGAFVLPLLLADLLGGGDPPRSVALVTTVDAKRTDAPPAPETAAIPDLRPTRALPRLAPAAGGAAAPAAAAPAPAAPATEDAAPEDDTPAAPTAGPASAPAPSPAPQRAPAPAPSSGGGGGTGSFENSGTGSGSFEDSD
ncbi:MAG: hypothetical protein JHC84_12460 [Solirubrobacteraceae bacterium]|nr:hypothetical protein [Solirubrobacteraceae bacterium]